MIKPRIMGKLCTNIVYKNPEAVPQVLSSSSGAYSTRILAIILDIALQLLPTSINTGTTQTPNLNISNFPSELILKLNLAKTSLFGANNYQVLD